MKLPKPTIEILELMATNGTPMTPTQIQKSIGKYSAKDIKYALRRLREKKIIRQRPNLLDMRRVYYRLITRDEISEILPELSEDEVKVFTPIFTGTITSA